MSGDGWHDAWVAALDELELTLEQTERLLAEGYVDPPAAVDQQAETVPQPWQPPRLEGPMPGDLRTRALALFHRQQQLIEQATTARTSVHRQLSLLGRVAAGRRGTRDEHPVYLDVTV
ncbi:MAG TPA: hypothetical protein VF049_05875 [Nocardioidaceae bacterium]|jgi:hypothetical protein